MRSAAQSTFIGAGVGAGLMLLFDPARGGERRAFVRGKLVRLVQRRTAVSDREISARVRAELGRAASRPHSITVSCRKGCVTLSGDVLGTDAPSIAAAVSKVPGVHSVRNQMTFHARAIPRHGRTSLRHWTGRLAPAQATLFWLGAGTAVLAVAAGLRRRRRSN
jgi:hypothetical protein